MVSGCYLKLYAEPTIGLWKMVGKMVTNLCLMCILCILNIHIPSKTLVACHKTTRTKGIIDYRHRNVATFSKYRRNINEFEIILIQSISA